MQARLLIVMLALFMLMLWPHRAMAGLNQWTGNGPFGGTFQSVVVSPNFATDKTVYAGSWGSGVFKSTDGGATWLSANAGLTDTFVHTLVVSPAFATDQTLFAGTNNGTVFKSTNGGATWTAVYTGLADTLIYSLATSPNYAVDQTIYAGTSRGALVSTNGGGNWAFVNTGLTNSDIRSLAMSPNFANDQTIYAGTNGGGVFRSTVGGATWAAVNTGLTDAFICSLTISPAYATDQTIYAGTSSGGAFLSTDSGSYWTAVNSGLASQEIRSLALSPAFATDRTLYAGTADGKVFMSSNGGTAWTTTALNSAAVYSLALSPNYAVDQVIYAGTNGAGLFMSASGGATWSPASSGLTNSDIRSLAISPAFAADQTLYAGTNGGGVFLSNNGGSDWTAVNSGIATPDIRSLAISPNYTADQTLYAGTNGGGVFKSTNGGTSWSTVNAGLTNLDIYALAISPNFSADQTIYAGTNGGGVFMSNTGGAGWTATSLNSAVVYSLAISPNYAIDPTIFAGTNGGGVMSSNGGMNWTPFNTGLTNTSILSLALSPNFAIDQTLYAGTNGSGVFKSTNGGTNWTATGLAPPYVPSLALSPIYGTDQTVFAGTFGGGVYKSTNGGSSWATLNAGLTNLDIYALAVSPAFAVDQTLLAGTMGSGVFSFSTTMLITAPATGAVLKGANYTITGTAAGAGAGIQKVEVSFNNGLTWNLANGTTYWSYIWTLPATGNYTIKARATDNVGNVQVASVAVIVDNIPPTSTITAPASGAAIKGTGCTVTGTASDAGAGIQKVEVSFDNGVTWSAATGTTSWIYAWTTPPADGSSYTILARATDKAGNVQGTSATVSGTVDGTPPNIAITIPTSGSKITGSSYTVTGTASDTGSGIKKVEVSFSGAVWYLAAVTGTTWSYTGTPPATGSSIQARATDNTGNVQTTSVAVTIDTVPPTSTITTPTSGFAAIKGPSYAITGTATDTGSGVQKVEVSVDNGATWLAATGTTSWSYAWTPSVVEGASYGIQARATDNAGNVQVTPFSVSGIVDSTPPNVSITTPAGGAILTVPSCTVTGTAADTGSGLKKVEVSFNGTKWYPAGINGTTWSYTGALPNTGSTIQARATDNAGNVQTASIAVTIDTAPPTSTIITPAGGFTVIKGPSYAITGTAADVGSGVQKVEVSLDNGATWLAASGTSSWSYAWTPPPADGTGYAIQARATDNAGNAQVTPTNISGIVDNTPPNVTITAPVSGSILTMPAFTVTGTVTDTGSGIKKVEVSFNGSSWYPAAVTGTTWSYLATLPASGNSIQARATDNAGNVQTTSVTVTIDTVPPTSTIKTPAGGFAAIIGPSYAISGTASDNGSGIQKVEVSLDSGATWSPAIGTTFWSYAWTALPADGGTYTIQARATDNTGNVQVTPTSVAGTVDNTPPSVSITSPVGGEVITGRSGTITGTAADTGSGIQKVEVSFNGTTWSSATVTGTMWSYTGTLPTTGSTIKARATDNAGNVQIAGIAVTIDNAPPTSTITAPAGSFLSIKGPSYAITGTATDTGSGVQKVEVSFDNGTTWLAATGTTTWSYPWTTFPVDGASYAIQARATDNAGNVQVSPMRISGFVDNTPPTVTITAPASGAILTAPSYTITGTATDAVSGIQKVEVSFNGSTWFPAVVTGTTWSYTGILPTTGSTIKARATDNAGNAQVATIAVTIDSVPPTSKITAPVGGYAAIKGTNYAVTGTTTDTGSGVKKVEISFDNGITWLAASGTTSWSYSWTSLPADGASYTIQVRATDNAGNVQVTPASVSGTVDTAPPSVAITAPASGDAITTPSYKVIGTVADTGSGVQKVEVSLNGTTWYPAVVAGTTWSWSGTLSVTGNVTIKARATDNVGNIQIANAAATIDYTPPTSTITAPAGGFTVIKGTSFTIAGTSADIGSGVQKVEVSFDNGTSWFTAIGATSWSYPWTTFPADGGNYTILARATDNVGNVQMVPATVTGTVDNTSPSVAITAPTSDTVFTGMSYTVTGTASDSVSGIKKVEVSFNGSTWYSAVVTGTNWSYTWTTPAAATAIQVRATDNAGNVQLTSVSGINMLVYQLDGDLNGDGKVDAKDALLALRIAVRLDAPTPLQLLRGDVAPLVNGTSMPDGKIDIDDALVILRKSVGL